MNGRVLIPVLVTLIEFYPSLHLSGSATGSTSTAKNKPTITANILNIRLIANTARNPIRLPEPIVNNVGATLSTDNITS